MTIVPPEIASQSFELDPSKEVFLKGFRPKALMDEIDDFRAEGYDIVIGDTTDRAYENLDMITDVFNMLDRKGREFSASRSKGLIAQQSFRDVVTLLPSGTIKSTAREWMKASDSKDDAIRSELLYGLPEVQGAPWHRQNGRALSLGTIVDAHQLVTPNGPYVEGGYPTMSGRLTADLIDHQFGPSTGSMYGKTLTQVLRENVSPKLTLEAAEEKVGRELEEIREFTTAPSYEGFKDIVAYCSDSLGIRSRKEEVAATIRGYVEYTNKDEYLMMSVGCGTAQPMLEVIRNLRDSGKRVKLVLVDQDPVALAAAEQLAGQMGLEDSIEIHRKQLFVGRGAKTRVMDIQEVLQDRELDVCEDSGLREYFPDNLYLDLARQSWNALAPGGMVTTGNMNKNRPQQEFLHGLMGWPIPVRMRNIKELARLHQSAGIPRQATSFKVTQEGVYTLCASIKK